MYQYMFANLNIKLVLIHVCDNFLAINLLFIKKKKEREVVLNKCLLNIMQVIFLKVVLNLHLNIVDVIENYMCTF